MNFRQPSISFPVLAVALGIAQAACAQHFDIFLARPASGTQTVIGGADVDGQAFDDVTRVFESEMTALSGEFFAVEPGVNHPNLNSAPSAYPASAAGLLPGDVLRLKERDFLVDRNLDDLFYWNGVGPVSFAPAAANFRVEEGDPLGSTAGAGGAFDNHPFLFVDSDALAGIYLASVFGVVDGFNPSDPVYLVMATGEDFEEVHGLAAEYVQTNVVVPEPASLELLAVACGVILTVLRGEKLLRSDSGC